MSNSLNYTYLYHYIYEERKIKQEINKKKKNLKYNTKNENSPRFDT